MAHVDELHLRLAARIREVAARRRIAVTHLPDRAGVARSHFWEILKGTRSPTLRWIGKVAAVLGVDAADLVRKPPEVPRRRS